MTSRFWAVIAFSVYVLGIIVCLVLDQSIFNNGHHPITNNYLPIILLISFLYSVFDIKGISNMDALDAGVWFFVLLPMASIFYFLARIVGFRQTDLSKEYNYARKD